MALLADGLLRRPGLLRVRSWLARALVVSFLGYAAYQTYYVEALNRHGRASVAAYQAGFNWLQRQPGGAVLAPEPMHDMYFRFFAHTHTPHRAWQLDMVPQPTHRYRYVVAFPNQRGAFQPQYSFPPAFANGEVEIFVLPQP